MASGEDDRKTEAEFLKMIQDRRVKVQEVERSVELSKDADTKIKNFGDVFNTMISCIQKTQTEFTEAIERKQPISYDAEVTRRTAMSQLEKTLAQEMKRTSDVDLRMIRQYEVDVTLDPDTANPWLILSEDGKQVSFGGVKRNLPDNAERFSHYRDVLGKQSFSAGRFYFEVQVGGMTEWEVGVAKESINRKDHPIRLSPSNGYWTIGLPGGNEYRANAAPVAWFSVRGELQKVGVLVDFEEGLVSFYDVEASVHLYSFTGCTFTDRLYPYIHADPNINSAPLVITPVNPTNEG